MPFSMLTQNYKDSAGFCSYVFDLRVWWYDERAFVSSASDLIAAAGLRCSKRRDRISWLTIIDHGTTGGQEIGNTTVQASTLTSYENLQKRPPIQDSKENRELAFQYQSMMALKKYLAQGATVLLGGCFAASDGGSLVGKLSQMWPSVRVIAFNVEQVAGVPGWQGDQYTGINGQIFQGRKDTFGMSNFPFRPKVEPLQ